jgi:UDP-GlcNAc:undecaprenyl-phosphate GlcNAc-1-phosphate transferase
MVFLLHSHRLGQHSVATLPAALFLSIISYFDDVRDWPFVIKLGAQVVACIAVMAGGAVIWRITLADHAAIDLGVVGLVLTLCWLLFVTNAVNFIDGLNGLASGSVALAAIALAAGAQTPLALQAGLLVAGIAGFLPFNYPKARIFMGDVGSQVCGFLIACLAVQAACNPQIWLIVPLALLPVLADVAFTLGRRACQRQNLTQAHRGHFYQVANRSGMPAWAVAQVYWGMAAWGGAVGVVAGKTGTGAVGAIAALVLSALPFAVWSGFVVYRAKQAGLTKW